MLMQVNMLNDHRLCSLLRAQMLMQVNMLNDHRLCYELQIGISMWYNEIVLLYINKNIA